MFRLYVIGHYPNKNISQEFAGEDENVERLITDALTYVWEDVNTLYHILSNENSDTGDDWWVKYTIFPTQPKIGQYDGTVIVQSPNEPNRYYRVKYMFDNVGRYTHTCITRG